MVSAKRHPWREKGRLSQYEDCDKLPRCLIGAGSSDARWGKASSTPRLKSVGVE